MTMSRTIETDLIHVPGAIGDLYCQLLRPHNSDMCVVISSSICGEFEANYHRERLLGMALAQEGVAVARFHYGGEGNSFGDRHEMTLTSMIEDAHAIVAHVRHLGYRRLAYVGTRLGCFVAAALADFDRSAPLVLWEPLQEGSDLIRDARRKQRMSRLSRGTEPSVQTERVSPSNGVDLFGYDVYPPLTQSLDEAHLVDMLGSPRGGIFLGHFDASEAFDPVAEALTEAGFSLDVASFDVSEAWWYQSEHEPESGDLVASTAAWIKAALGVR
jgi:hypothetical protein